MMNSKTIKYILFLLILSILFFPIVFQLFEGTITKKLRGYNANPEKVELTFENIQSGQWQNYMEVYFKNKLQIRHFLIRLNNQIKFSLFDHLNANSVLRGKNDYYFEYRYIQAYLGLNYQGEEHYEKKIAKLLELKDTLKAHNIEFLYVIASGKANYMPENIPTEYDHLKKTRNNYEAFLSQLNQTDIKYLDFNQYMLDMKDTASYPLYTKSNIHWSFYALSFLSDSLINTIEQQLDKSLPKYQRAPLRMTDEPTYYTEEGIFESLNLYWTELPDTFHYRDNIIPEKVDSTFYKPKVWTVGDSYYGTLHTYKIPHQYFDEQSLFFYYNNSVVDQVWRNYYPGKIDDFIKEINNIDLLMFFTTDAGIPGCSWGAEDVILDYFKKK